jgi:hypothetical protein
MRGTEIEVPNQPDVIPIVKHSKREETDGLEREINYMKKGPVGP